MILVKVGGGKDINYKGIAEDLASINESVIIVHGANYYRDELAKKLQVSKRVLTSVSGYSSVFSDENAIELLMMAYAGLRNKLLVESLQRVGLNAIGLSGLDGALIRGKRNKGIKIMEKGKKKIVRDLSGKPETINKELLDYLLYNKYIPVLTVPIIDEQGFAINTENDSIITLLQRFYQANTLIQLIEAPGILRSQNKDGSIFSILSLEELNDLEKNANARFKRKLYALRKLLEVSHVKIIISDGRVAHPIRNALEENGTVISNE